MASNALLICSEFILLRRSFCMTNMQIQMIFFSIFSSKTENSNDILLEIDKSKVLLHFDFYFIEKPETGS